MNANTAGRVLEDVLAAALTSIGVVFERQVVIGRSIYDTELRADFVLLNIKAYPDGLIVEAKWQDVGGSIDEKFPYLVANIRSCFPMPAIVIVDGGGCREGARRWLHAQCDGQQLVAIYSIADLLSWLLRVEKIAVAEFRYGAFQHRPIHI